MLGPALALVAKAGVVGVPSVVADHEHFAGPDGEGPLLVDGTEATPVSARSACSKGSLLVAVGELAWSFAAGVPPVRLTRRLGRVVEAMLGLDLRGRFVGDGGVKSSSVVKDLDVVEEGGPQG